MQADFYYRTQQALSTDRLQIYRQPGMDDFDALANYLWNIRLSEALYPVLHLLEVGLRNRLHDALTYRTHRRDWYDVHPTVLQQRELDSVAEAKNYLASQQKPVDPGRIVAELNLGFWISFFNARYSRLWPAIAARVLPSMPRRERTQANALKVLGPVRLLRNRVFHHEIVLHMALPLLHADALKAIGWISPELLHLATAIDKFPSTYADGWQSVRRELMDFSFPVDYSI